MIRALRLIFFRKAEVSVECWHFCLGQQQIYDDTWQYSSLDHACHARPHPTQPTSFACWWSSNFSSSLSCSAGSATCEWNTCFPRSVKLLTFGGSLKTPAWWMKAAETIPPTPSSLGEPFIPVRRSAHMRSPWPLSPKKSMEHSSIFTRERSVPATTTREMSSTSLLSWIHEIWSISTPGPISESTMLTSRMTKRGKCHCTVAGTPQKIWSYPLQRAAKHPGHAAFQERGLQTLPKTSTLYNLFLETSHSTKCLTSPSKLDGLHVDIWNNQRKSFCWA